ncbi:hypothetical protein KIN20_022364 [Parelaphostrongylus tenuis]|uniref:Uncharacterized protein n=1 Tax=Parelaphostrongylus tenuis TaxID=148309 RepID=A0AAD5MTY5_PARTN|nr:hypothetical protein KIN20_022364 [Parelaphostrongylus tenuis]
MRTTVSSSFRDNRKVARGTPWSNSVQSLGTTTTPILEVVFKWLFNTSAPPN